MACLLTGHALITAWAMSSGAYHPPGGALAVKPLSFPDNLRLRNAENGRPLPFYFRRDCRAGSRLSARNQWVDKGLRQPQERTTTTAPRPYHMPLLMSPCQRLLYHFAVCCDSTGFYRCTLLWYSSTVLYMVLHCSEHYFFGFWEYCTALDTI